MSETMKERSYETIYIIRADLTDEAEKKVQDKVSETVVRFGGRIESLKDLMKRPLAYPIAKHTKGHYIQLNFVGTGKVVEELERHLRLTEDVIRFLTVKPNLPNVPRPGKEPVVPTSNASPVTASEGKHVAPSDKASTASEGLPTSLATARDGRQEVLS